MNLTKGHNNLTKLNEIASCICGRFCNEKQHMALDRNFHIIEELYCVFKIKYSRCQVSHKRRSYKLYLTIS